MSQWGSKTSENISNFLRQPRHRAKNVGRAPIHRHSRTHSNEQEYCEPFLKICTRNRRQIRPDGIQMSNKSLFVGVSGPCVGSLGAQQAQKPTRMHFRLREPRSWLTIGGCFLVQFVLSFACFLLCFRHCAQVGLF